MRSGNSSSRREFVRLSGIAAGAAALDDPVDRFGRRHTGAGARS